MASTAAERKAAETKRKSEQGLKRKSFWLSQDEFKIIESFKISNDLKTNDEALQQILKKSQAYEIRHLTKNDG